MNAGGDHPGVVPVAPAPIDPLRISDTDRLISFLHNRDEPCPLCAYNLRDLTSPRCPECGHLLKLTVAQAEPYFRAWIMVLVANCTCAGLGVVWILMMIRRGAPRVGMYILVFHILTIPCLPILLRTRTAFLKMERGTQLLLGWLAIVACAVSVGAVAFRVN